VRRRDADSRPDDGYGRAGPGGPSRTVAGSGSGHRRRSRLARISIEIPDPVGIGGVRRGDRGEGGPSLGARGSLGQPRPAPRAQEGALIEGLSPGAGVGLAVELRVCEVEMRVRALTQWEDGGREDVAQEGETRPPTAWTESRRAAHCVRLPHDPAPPARRRCSGRTGGGRRVIREESRMVGLVRAAPDPHGLCTWAWTAAVSRSAWPEPMAPCISLNTTSVSPVATPCRCPPNSPGVSCSNSAMASSSTSTSR